MYFSDSCISRAAPALLMIPKFVLPSVPFGLFQLTQLNALNASIRNWIWRRSRMSNDLASERSTTLRPGPTTGLRGDVP